MQLIERRTNISRVVEAKNWIASFKAFRLAFGLAVHRNRDSILGPELEKARKPSKKAK